MWGVVRGGGVIGAGGFIWMAGDRWGQLLLAEESAHITANQSATTRCEEKLATLISDVL